MKVVCVKELSKLIKGVQYEVGSVQSIGSKTIVYLPGFGRFNADNFRMLDGSPVSTLTRVKNGMAPVAMAQQSSSSHLFRVTEKINSINFSELNVGDILVCNTDRYKTFTTGCMYQISELISTPREIRGYNGAKHTYDEQKIRFSGINQTIKFNKYAFRELTLEESREISLESVLSGKKPNIIKDQKIRKIDLVPNKPLMLMKFLSQSICDEQRHHLSIVDWACKIGKKYDLKPEDFTQLLDKKLEDIFKDLD